MKELEAMLFDLLQDRKKRWYLIGGTALALLLIAFLLTLLLGGSGRKYNRYYNEAEAAYAAGDYTAAEEKLRRAMELKSTEKAYMLMADIYCATGETDRAIQILYLGYSHVGSARIEARLEALKSGRGNAPVSPVPVENMTIGGKLMDGSVSSLVLSGTKLKEDDLQSIAGLTRLESLGISDCGIRDIGFLSGASGLTFLQISDNSVRDLTPLAGMKHLKTLYIDNNPITDLTPLYGLSALRTLSMKGIDVEPKALSELRDALPNCSIYADEPEETVSEIKLGGRTIRTDVTELDLGGLDLTDISALRACADLEKLDLRDNEITDLSPLVELPKLKWLCIWNNKVEDIYPLLSLSAMEYLDADGNEISDISVLEYLPHLQEVWLNGNPVASFAPLRTLKELTRLGLAETDLKDEDLELLAELTELTELNIKGNSELTAGAFDKLCEALPKCKIDHDKLLYAVRFGDREFRSDLKRIDADGLNVDDISALKDFTELQILSLKGNHISDLSPLQDLTGLQELRLDGSSISDLAPLSGLKALQVLSLAHNSAAVLTPLAGCTGLRELNLSGNGITDITPLRYLSALEHLELADNQIVDLSALYGLSNLKTLDLRGNPLKADDILALQTSLPDCEILHDIELPDDPEQPTETQTPDLPPIKPATDTDLE